MEGLGDGIWIPLLDNKVNVYAIDASSSILQYKDVQLFRRLEEDGYSVELPWSKVTVLFNLARLLEQLNNTETASILYRLILFKVRINMKIAFYYVILISITMDKGALPCTLGIPSFVLS